MIEDRAWDEFIAGWKWRQGEHLTMIGPTGAGKTTLAVQLLERRSYILTLATKKRDPLITHLGRDGYERVKQADAINKDVSKKFIVAPPLSDTNKSILNQRRVFNGTLEAAFRQGGWTVYLDEAWYVCKYLGLAAPCQLLLQQGRSLGVTMVAGTQRPVEIPLSFYNQPTHLFFWRDNDEANLKRIGGLGGIAAKPLREAVSVLSSHEVLYLNTRTGSLTRTIPPKAR